MTRVKISKSNVDEVIKQVKCTLMILVSVSSNAQILGIFNKVYIYSVLFDCLLLESKLESWKSQLTFIK